MGDGAIRNVVIGNRVWGKWEVYPIQGLYLKKITQVQNHNILLIISAENHEILLIINLPYKPSLSYSRARKVENFSLEARIKVGARNPVLWI